MNTSAEFDAYYLSKYSDYAEFFYEKLNQRLEGRRFDENILLHRIVWSEEMSNWVAYARSWHGWKFNPTLIKCLGLDDCNEVHMRYRKVTPKTKVYFISYDTLPTYRFTYSIPQETRLAMPSDYLSPLMTWASVQVPMDTIRDGLRCGYDYDLDVLIVARKR